MSLRSPPGIALRTFADHTPASHFRSTKITDSFSNEHCHFPNCPDFRALYSGSTTRKTVEDSSPCVDIPYRLNGIRQHLARICELDVNVSQDASEKKNIDITTLGNLCVDIVLNVPDLPPPSLDDKLVYMRKLAESSPGEKYWEAGGNSNVAIAAARLGLHCVALGHVGPDKYGSFLQKVLKDEGVQIVKLTDEGSLKCQYASEETLLCWVLIDPSHHHGFFSRFDFNKEPAFHWFHSMPLHAKRTIERSRVLLCNGFLFDELSPNVIASTIDFASDSKCSIFFDPGPRAYSVCQGTPEQQATLHKFLELSDVLLLTSDEAEALTGLRDPVLSAKLLLERGWSTKWVIVKMGEKGSLMATSHGVYRMPAFKVDVVDTVGCGDSFAAAIALGFNQGLPVMNTLALANAVGAATAMGCGAGRNVATLHNIVNILSRSEARFLENSDLDFENGALDRDAQPQNSALQAVSCEALDLLMKSLKA